MSWIIPPVKGLVDPYAAPVIKVDGIGAVRFRDGEVTVYYYETEPSLHGGEDQAVVRVIMKRRAEEMVQSMSTVATFAHRLMFKGAENQPFTVIPTSPRIVK